MKFFKITALSFICTYVSISTVQAQENVLKDVKLGFGYDRGFGVIGTIGQFNGFIGNDGVAVDYIFLKNKLDESNPLYWYVGGGGFGDWNGDFGARLPVGVEFYFAQNLDAYAQVMPRFRFRDNNGNNDIGDFGLDYAIGVRYQF